MVGCEGAGGGGGRGEEEVGMRRGGRREEGGVLPDCDVVHQDYTPIPACKLRRPREGLDEWVVAVSAAAAGGWFLVDAIVSIPIPPRNQQFSSK